MFEKFSTNQINQWCKNAGSDENLEFWLKFSKTPITATDASNPYWVAFKEATDEL